MALFRDNRRIRPVKTGAGFELRFPAEERELLARLPLELVELLEMDASDDPAIARLFPDAYAAADADLAEEYRRLMSDDLRERFRGALETLSATSGRDRVSADELYGWMTALGQLRLVIGTRIGVTEEMRDDDSAEYGLYTYLSWLQEQAVAALSTTL